MGTACLASSSRNVYFCLLSLCFVVLLQGTSGRKLTYVLLLYRHGDRSPIEIYPNCLHNETEWPQGFGQLTKIGIQQQYELGQYLRKRYSNFLSATYQRQEILIKSTELDRTIMSAQSNLAGLYPPTGDQIWNPEILWQPIPIHVVPRSYNPKMALYKDSQWVAFQKHLNGDSSPVQKLRFPIFDCPYYRQLLKETMTSSEFQKKIQSHAEFINTLALYSGYDPDMLKVLDNFKLWHIQDTLFCESVHNYTLPEWATEDVKAKLASLTVLSLSSLFGIYKREEKARLQGGLLVKSILETLSEAAKYPDKRKMLIYSAHDTTLGALQMALNIYNERLPPYASCQIFELYEENNGEHTIEMYFRNDTSRDPYPLILPGCSAACPLSRFSELVSPILVEDWASECGYTETRKGTISQAGY